MTGTVIWLAVLGSLAALFAFTLRRMSMLIGRTHELERYQRGVDGIARRLAATTDPFVLRLDEIRRRSGDPQGLREALPALQDALRGLAAEGRVMRAPSLLAQQSVAFQVELDRAVRAGDLVEHGLDALMADRGGRDLEAQTSLKRAALNLRHARDAVARIALEIGALRPADLAGRPDALTRGARPPAVPTYLVDADVDAEGR